MVFKLQEENSPLVKNGKCSRMLYLIKAGGSSTVFQYHENQGCITHKTEIQLKSKCGD